MIFRLDIYKCVGDEGKKGRSEKTGELLGHRISLKHVISIESTALKSVNGCPAHIVVESSCSSSSPHKLVVACDTNLRTINNRNLV